MNYPEEICAPMRAELTSVGFVELKTPEEVAILLEKRRYIFINGEFCLWMCSRKCSASC